MFSNYARGKKIPNAWISGRRIWEDENRQIMQGNKLFKVSSHLLVLLIFQVRLPFLIFWSWTWIQVLTETALLFFRIPIVSGAVRTRLPHLFLVHFHICNGTFQEQSKWEDCLGEHDNLGPLPGGSWSVWSCQSEPEKSYFVESFLVDNSWLFFILKRRDISQNFAHSEFSSMICNFCRQARFDFAVCKSEVYNACNLVFFL